MKKNWFVLVLALALSTFTVQRAEAQVDFGVQGLYNTDWTSPDGSDGAAGIGARAGIGLPVVGLGLKGDFNWYFPDCGSAECDYWEIVANLTYSILGVSPVSPYFGGGLAYQATSIESLSADISSDDPGFNLLGGLEVGGLSPISGYGEVSYRLMDDHENQLILSVGLLF